MSRALELRATVARAQDRARYCERQFTQFCSGADLSGAAQQRTHRKLRADWDRALRDAQWAQRQLEQALDVEGMTL